MRDLRDVLVNEYGLGATLTGWSLTNPTALNHAGTIVVGYGTNPNGDKEAWIANLATVPGPDANFNEVGGVDGADLANWQAGFGATGMATHMQGDADGDGDADGEDFLIWQRQVSGVVTVAANSAVPEPAIVQLVVLGVLAVFLQRRATNVNQYGA
jgi:hypothetical protein